MTDRPAKPTNPGSDRIDIAGTVAHPARVYDYVLGGSDNFDVDRKTAEHAAAASAGGIDHARAAVQADQAFFSRAISYLGEEVGVRQFLDLGARVPHTDTTHEIAQRIAPESRVVYVNNDPVVLAHAHTLRRGAPEGATAYIDADPRQPEAILQQVPATLDLRAPIGIVVTGLLHHISDDDDPYGIVARFVDAVPSGSYLVISHITSDIMADEVTEAARRINQQPGFTLTLRTGAQIARFLDGLDIVEPGLVPVDRWHPPASPPPQPEPWPIPFFGGIGHKP